MRQRAAWKLGVGGWGFVGAAALLVAVLWPSGAFAQAGGADEEAFKRGLDARDKKNWRQAATEMRAASERSPTESTQKVGGRLGIGGTEYLPHYFLGEALFYLEDCVGAVTQWEISEQQPAIRTKPQFVDFMKKGYATCATRGVLPPAEFNTQSAAAKQAVDEAVTFAERVSKTGNADAWRPELREQYSKIGPDLNTAQAKLAAGMRTRLGSDFNDARAAAGRVVTALKLFDGVLKASIVNLGEVQRQARDVDQGINEAQAKDNAIDGLKTTLTPELTTLQLKGRDALTRARNQLAAGQRTQNTATVSEASNAAREAATILEQVLAEATKLARGALEQQLGEAGAAASEALSFLESQLATLGTRFLNKRDLVTPDLEAQRDALDKRVAGLRRRIEAGQKNQNVGELKDAARRSVDIRSELDKLMAAFGPLSLRDRGVPAALEDGARQLFAGEYQQALATLESVTDARLQLHVHLFRAAALYHLFVRSAEKDQALRTRAIAEIDACKRLNSQFIPDSRAFAPRFVTFYQNAAPAAP